MKEVIHKLANGVLVKEVVSTICTCKGCYFETGTNGGRCKGIPKELPDCVFDREGEVRYVITDGPKPNILLDMDGCIVDFLSGVIRELNKAYGRNVTLEQYSKEFGQWSTYDYYGITVGEFWKPINDCPDFWLNLEPFPWTTKLFTALSALGEVTIVTAPSNDPECSKQKLMWLEKHLGVKSSAVFLGHRKYLMAGNGILIDDYHKNTDAFKEAGGQAILIPSTWNKFDVTFEEIWETISKQIP